MKLEGMILAGTLAVLATPTYSATLTNGGFETGDLSDWTYTDGYVEVVTEAEDAIATPPFGELFTATEGSYFARLTAGVDLDVYTLLSQPFEVLVASSLSGNAAFLAFDYLPYDDDGFVRVYSASTDQIVFASSVGAAGDFGHTTWTSFTTGPLAPGSYTFEAGVRDRVELGYSSQLLLDNIAITALPTAAVPEPTTWGLMILGFAGLGLMLRMQRTRTAVVRV